MRTAIPNAPIKTALTIFLAAAILSFSPVRSYGADAPTTRPVIFVCGDSTAKNSQKDKKGLLMVGWGTTIPAFFDPSKAVINNVGHAGRSSLTYYNGDWPRVLPLIHSGDYVLLVFGINDGTTPNGTGDDTRPSRTGDVQHTYGWYMSKMATDAEAKGAHGYLLTVTTRDIWRNPKVNYTDATPVGPLPADYNPADDHIERGTGNGKYTQWTKDVAAKLHIPVFDLTNFCADKYEAMGRETVSKLYSDHNHTYEEGAEIVASCIVSGLKAFKDSPFIPLLSDRGHALPTADAKYVSDNLPN
jgi:lysophospholipase L1-like esterase